MSRAANMGAALGVAAALLSCLPADRSAAEPSRWSLVSTEEDLSEHAYAGGMLLGDCLEASSALRAMARDSHSPRTFACHGWPE